MYNDGSEATVDAWVSRGCSETQETNDHNLVGLSNRIYHLMGIGGRGLLRQVSPCSAGWSWLGVFLLSQWPCVFRLKACTTMPNPLTVLKAVSQLWPSSLQEPLRENCISGFFQLLMTPGALGCGYLCVSVFISCGFSSSHVIFYSVIWASVIGFRAHLCNTRPFHLRLTYICWDSLNTVIFMDSGVRMQL